MEKSSKTWKKQHIAFRLKWSAAGFIEIIATIALFASVATFPEWLTAQGIIATFAGIDAAMKIKKEKNGEK